MAAPARILPSPNSGDPIQAVRRFNRFYTRQIGVLQEHLLHSEFSLTEVRVLYELAHRPNITAAELCHELGLDRGYLSRMLQSFEKQKWIKTTPSPADRRRSFLSMTSKGKKVFAPLDRRSSEEVAAMLARLSAEQQQKLVRAMCEIESLLGARPEKQIPRGLKPARNDKSNETFVGTTGSRALPGQEFASVAMAGRLERVERHNSHEDQISELTGKGKSSTRANRKGNSPPALAAEGLPQKETETGVLKGPSPSYTLRPHRPGDMGWVVQRHGELYWKEYSYDERFEALVAEIVAEFIQTFDPKCERCWIAEKDGEPVGAIFLVRKSKTVAKLRLLLVEPSARGFGIGKRLVSHCVDFAQQSGYKKIFLWTQSELHAARHLYEQAGFKRIEQTSHQSWGRTDLIAETWELKL